MTGLVPGVTLPLAAAELYLRGTEFSDYYRDAGIVRGTGSAEDIKQAGAGRGVILSKGAGPGLIAEWAFDQPILTVRAFGKQGSYDDAEEFAGRIDRWLLSDTNVNVGGYPALYVTRAGGGPTHIGTDAARRAHFSCSYVIPVASHL